MQSVAVFVALLAAASASSLVYRVPSQDSAVINSQRLGGNFAYNVAEGHAYGVQTPVYSYLAQQQPITTYSQVGASGLGYQTVQQNGQQLLSYSAQVPTYQQQVLQSPVVASTYSVPSYSVPSYSSYSGLSPINYGSVYGLQYAK